MLAKCEQKLGKPDEARQWCKKALQVEIKTPDDREAHKQAEALLAAL
jgi:hypothetical protein